MQASGALGEMDSRYSRGLKELIYSLLQRNPDDRPDVYLAMANPFLVNALMNLCTDIGRLPCTRCVCVCVCVCEGGREGGRESVCVCVCVSPFRPYSKPDGRASESGMESGTADSAMMGSGLRKGLRQRSFFEDEYSTVTGGEV